MLRAAWVPAWPCGAEAKLPVKTNENLGFILTATYSSLSIPWEL